MDLPLYTPFPLIFHPSEILHSNVFSGSVLLTQYCAGDKIEKNEMGWICGSYG